MKCQQAIKMWKINPVTQQFVCRYVIFKRHFKDTAELVSDIHRSEPIVQV